MAAQMRKEQSQMSLKDGVQASRASSKRVKDNHPEDQPLIAGEQVFASNIDDGISSRPFTAADAVELEAIR